MNILSVSEANPVGQAHDVLDEFIAELKKKWDAEKVGIKTSAWWKFWENSKPSMMMAISFLLNCLDELIQHIEEFKDLAGQDKKATVLRACRIIYEYVVRETLPIWLKPFAGSVEALVIDILISYAIDWIVDKYRNGFWKEQPKDEQTDKNTQEQKMSTSSLLN